MNPIMISQYVKTIQDERLREAENQGIVMKKLEFGLVLSALIGTILVGLLVLF